MNLAGLTAAVVGINASTSYGAASDNIDINMLSEDQDHDTDECLEPQAPSRRRKRVAPALDLLSEQVDNQTKFHSELLNILQLQTKKVDDMAYYTKQISKQLKDLQAIKTQQLHEQRRHNLAMEKIALEKFKTKKEFIQVQIDNL